MTGFFNMPKPRRFTHRYIYVDERKERLRRMEQNARKELGIENTNVDDMRSRMHDAFTRDMRHLPKHGNRYAMAGSMLQSLFMIAVLAAVLIVVTRMLLEL